MTDHTHRVTIIAEMAYTLTMVLALVVSCQSATNCHWGPSYWCQDEVIAEECGGTQYCRDKVWKVARRGEDVCAACKMTVNFLKGMFNGNTTNSWNVCEMTELCNSSKLVTLAKSQTHQQPPDVPCDACKEFFDILKPYTHSNTTKSQVKAALQLWCSFWPSDIAKEFNYTVNQLFNETWSWLGNEADNKEESCYLFGQCPNPPKNFVKFGTLAKVQLSDPSDEKCDVCTHVCAILKPYAHSSTTKGQVKLTLLLWCSFWPSLIAKECTDRVNTYFGDVWLILNQIVDNAHEACYEIGQCDSPTEHFM